MTNAAIIDGDTVIVREQPVALDGEIVVATVGGETTVKRLRLEGDNIRLMPENAAFAPIDVRGEDFKIHGVVIAVLRRLASAGPENMKSGRVHAAKRADVRSAP